MDLTLIAETWDVLRHHIDLNSRKEAAEELVAYMIENNCEPEDIKEVFHGDKEIIKALMIYDDQSLQDEDEDYYDDDYDDEEY